MKIALIQFNPIVGDFKGNVAKILSTLESVSADLYVFPELSVCGYCPQDLILKKTFVQENLRAVKEIEEQTFKNLIVGFVDEEKGKLYNAACLLSGNKIKEIYHKKELPNYSVFDEKRWFSKGENSGVFEFKDLKIGLNICEDAWISDVYDSQNKEGVDFFINIAASPYSSDKFDLIERTLVERSKETGKPIFYVNQVGGQDGLVYYGHSMYVKDGKVALRAKDFEEDVLVIDLNQQKEQWDFSEPL